MRSSIVPAVVALLLAFGAASYAEPRGLTTAEKKYVATRDAAEKAVVAEHEALSQPGKDYTPVYDLNKKEVERVQTAMREVLGRVSVEGFGNDGVSNVQTFIPEVGSGMMDGLAFRKGLDVLVVTTPNLVRRKFAGKGGEAPDLTALSGGQDDFYTTVFDPDLAYHPLAELPVTATPPLALARAFLVARSQELGPLAPDVMVVFAASDDRVLMVKWIIEKLPSSSACSAAWAKKQPKAAELFQRFQTSRSEGDFDAHRRLQAEAFSDYAECWATYAPRQPFYADMTARAQAFVDRLAPAAARDRQPAGSVK